MALDFWGTAVSATRSQATSAQLTQRSHGVGSITGNYHDSMRIARLALAALMTLSAAASRSVVGDDNAPPAFLRIEYRAVTTNESTDEDVKRKTPLVPRTEGTITAVLGPRRIEFVEEGRRTVLDHEHERVLRVETDGSYRETSLLANVAFIDMEMKNRARLAKVLAAAGMKDESARPRELSVLFGWRAKGDDTSITTAQDGGAIVFRDGDEELARWTPSAESLDEAQRASLARFLQFRCRLHPAVRDAIAADGHVPAAMRFRWLNTGTRSTTEMTLLGAKRSNDDGSIRLGQRVFEDSDPLAGVAKRVLDPAKDDAAPRLAKDDFVRLAREARKAGRYEDAAVLLIECGLQTGDAVTDELRDLRSDDAASPRLERLFGVIGEHDPAKQLQGLEALDRASFSRPHVLDVFRANSLAATNHLDDAVQAMLGALAKSPWLTGAWKDLGGFYYARFDTGRTWLAWEAGRRAAPDHPMWSQIQEFENHLRKAYRAIL